jgi:hypothetical protein
MTMLTQTLEKPTRLPYLVTRMRSITVKGALNTIIYVLVLLLLSSIAMFLMCFALAAAASTPY